MPPPISRRLRSLRLKDGRVIRFPAAPLLGADSEAVLTSLLNLTGDEIDRLRKAEVII
jgi:crotonobetainyl-CoA:carnitine CoA-transferase CaiB-like acyl-CoA transferase